MGVVVPLSVADLRTAFGRNFNITKEAQAKYRNLLQAQAFKDKDFKTVFMVSLALARSSTREHKPIKRYPLLNTNAFSDDDLLLITSIAIAEEGDLEILNNPDEIKKIAEEYAIVGLEILIHLVEEYRGGAELLLELEKRAHSSI